MVAVTSSTPCQSLGNARKVTHVLRLDIFGVRVVLSYLKILIGLPLVLAAFSAPAASGERVTGLEPRTEQTFNPERPALLRLSDIWKFKTDPERVGALPAQKWFAENLDDSSWSDLRSGRPWESQGVDFSGYAWYRQRFTITDTFKGMPLKITLAEIRSDDDIYFNGSLIGGLKGDYKYKNLILRTYFVPAHLVHMGAQNTIAIRIWGGRLGFQGAKSGLVAGPYSIEAVPFGLAARDCGAAPDQERPIQLFDLSDAQRGRPFDLVFRFDLATPSGGGGLLSYRLADFYGKTLKTGSAVLQKGRDGVARAVVPIDAATSQAIYLAGRFKATVLVKDNGTGAVLSQTIMTADHLSFAGRDQLALPRLPATYDSTPYGRLKLVDEIDAATPGDKEVHPYLQSGLGVHAEDSMTPGAEANVTVGPILGRGAREATWSWFAYRIGRGQLVPGHTYLVRISYPEDKPRFSPIEIQTGQDYMDIGWKNGVASDDVYDNWPLSHAWQDYDVVVPLGTETVGTGGTGDADAAHGFWIYFMDHRKPGYTLSLYQGGAAVSTIKLYEIDPQANAPHLNLPPRNLPRRTMTFDWERQPTAPPADIVSYAELMGYSAVSPTILKWGLTNFASPVRGYTSAGVDDAGYWVTGTDGPMSKVAPSAVAGQSKSIHEKYLEATRAGGIDYLPRVEYGGSTVLPIWARAIGANGRPAKPDRYGAWGADLLDPATLTDFQAYMDSLFRPYVESNPQLKGMLWRSRQDRMQISYSRQDIARFARESSITPPSESDGATPAEAAEWATTDAIAPLYNAWWQKKRAEFQGRVAQILKGYRADMSLLYFNWDTDKFSLLEPDRYSAAFFRKLLAEGGPKIYGEDEARRKEFKAADYISVLKTGLFSGSSPQLGRPSPWPDYALIPPLYATIDGVQLLAPVPGLPYANMPDYLNYFRTPDGLAVSNMVSYDEFGSREPNPKYETTVVLPGGAPFSMAVELLAYYYGDVRTLTYTAYTYGRGFADAHRRFAQAFRSLPAIPGQLLPGSPDDVAARIYRTPSEGTYLGLAYKGYLPRSFVIDVPGRWLPRMKVKNLVTGETVPVSIVAQKIQIKVTAGPMELNTFLIK